MTNLLKTNKKKGVPSAVGFPHCAGSGEGLFLSPKPYPHKCAEDSWRRNKQEKITVIALHNGQVEQIENQ